jgi:hypothetical protein
VRALSEEENRQGSSSEHSYVDDAIDKLQESRRGEGDPDVLDQAVDKAQEFGLVNKAVDKLKGMFGG